jgi:hypothetical protein
MDIEKFVDELAEQALRSGPAIQGAEPSSEPLGRVLEGRAVELWSTAAGRLFLVADEADARQAMERFGARPARVKDSETLRNGV